MTDTEPRGDAYHEAHLPIARDFVDQVGAAMLSGGDRGLAQVDLMVAALDAEQLEDLLVGLSARARIDTLMAGRVAYEIRKKTPDGEWGQEVRKLAMACEVSDRTIHRWMSAAQSHFGFELTGAQRNARATQAADEASAEPQVEEDSWESWDDDEEASAAGFFGVSSPDGLDGQLAMRDAVGEPWAEPDSVIPSVDYENVVTDRTERPAGRRVIPPDDTWLAFAESQVVAEHPALGPSGAAMKAAQLRWTMMSRDEPMELLEQLEMIHGGSVPDELASALMDAEDSKPIKPEVVKDKPKRKGGGAGASKTPEGLMVAVREMHSQIVSLKREGGSAAVAEKYGKSVADLQGLIHAAQGCLNKVRSAMEDVRKDAPPQLDPDMQDF